MQSKDYQERALAKVGTRHLNNSGKMLEIMELTEKRTKSGNVIYKAKFIESGYEIEVPFSNIKKGNIKDFGSPSVYGVGYTYPKRKGSDFIYKTWHHMLERCYSNKFHAYNRYGGKGVKVSEDWHYLKKFEKDIESLKNYDKYIESPNLYSLDKDILGDGLLYSKETCMFASYTEQVNAQKHVREIKAINETGEESLFISQAEAARTLSLQSKNINKVLMGKRKHAGGYKFEFVEG